MPQLDLGWCQGYMGLQYHMEEAYLEKKIDIKTITLRWDPPFALFSKKYYEDINNLDHTKKYDYCFIGNIESCYVNRKWVIDFVKNNFTENSLFINTDINSNLKSLGSFDKSHEKLGFNIKSIPDRSSKAAQFRIVNENKFYFETMCQSKFILCPAGDTSWSFRFYEVLMCKSMPIVQTWHHTYRTKEESEIKYNYLLQNNEINITDESYQNKVLENTEIFKKYHMLQ